MFELYGPPILEICTRFLIYCSKNLDFMTTMWFTNNHRSSSHQVSHFFICHYNHVVAKFLLTWGLLDVKMSKVYTNCIQGKQQKKTVLWHVKNRKKGTERQKRIKITTQRQRRRVMLVFTYLWTMSSCSFLPLLSPLFPQLSPAQHHELFKM